MKHGWSIQKLGNLFEFKYGRGLTAECRQVDGSVKVYGSNGIIGRHNHPLSKGATIIIGRKGSIGEVNFSPAACWPIDTTYYIDDFPDNFSPKYWALFLKSLRLGSHDRSSAIPGVSRKDIYGIDVPIPPISEQRRIIAKLERLLANVQSFQERLDKIPILLKRFRQSVLAAACSGRLTADWRGNESSAYGIPNNWKKYKLSALSVLITKGASPKWQGVSYAAQGILFVTSENVGSGKMLLETRKYVESKINEIQPRSILRKGDLLTNIVGASIGRSTIYDIDEVANINQAVALIRLRDNVDQKYILQVLNSPILVDHMNAEKVDVARANLSLKDVADFPILLPPLPEQKEIVHRVEALFKIADQIDARYQKVKAHIDKLTQSILAKAFRGELVHQDPNDEPASALLERIRALKSADAPLVKAGRSRSTRRKA